MNKTALIVCGTVIGAAAVCYGAYHYSQQIIPREKRNLINSILGENYVYMGKDDEEEDEDEDEEEAQGNVDVVVFNFDKDNRLLERAGGLNQKTLIITFARNTQQIQLDNSCKPVKYNEAHDQYIKFRDMYIVRRDQQLKLKKTLLLKQTTDDLRQVGLTNETKVSVTINHPNGDQTKYTGLLNIYGDGTFVVTSDDDDDKKKEISFDVLDRTYKHLLEINTCFWSITATGLEIQDVKGEASLRRIQPVRSTTTVITALDTPTQTSGRRRRMSRRGRKSRKRIT